MRCKLPLFATLLVLVAAMTQSLSATTHATVGLCAGSGTHYTSIHAALAVATAGETISVCPGIYKEQVLITMGLTLTGIKSTTTDAPTIIPPDAGLVQNGTDIFDNPVAAQIFVASTSGLVTISNLTIDGTGNNIAGCGAPTLEGIYFQNTSGTISGNTVRNQYQTDFTDYGGCPNGLAINIESPTASNSVTVSKNSVRAYQKNGITATGAGTGPGSLGPAVTISNNYIVGLGGTPMNWPGGAAENGIQFGFGATGTISTNVVNDNLWFGEYAQFNYDGLGGPTTGNAASGILIYSSNSVMVTGNSVGSAQLGIVAVTDPTYGPADNTTISTNKVSGTQVFDAIDVCSNSNTVTANLIYGSAESGVHVDDSCGSGNNNTVTKNTINEACAGVLLGTGSNTTTTPTNTFSNVTNLTLAGDSCPAAGPGARTEGQPKSRLGVRSSPYNPRTTK